MSLLPVPYVGNLDSAKIILCIANPGLADADYYAESQPAFRLALENNLKQAPNLEFPLVYLNPEFAWSPAHQWWTKLLKPIIDHFVEAGRKYVDTLQILSQNIAALELFPYHSRNVDEIQGWGNKKNLLPSVREMHRYFNDLAPQTQKLTVLLRSHELWAKSNYDPQTHSVIEAKRMRGLSFAAQPEVLKVIIKKLEDAL